MIENIAIKRIGFLNKKQREYTEYKLVQQAQNGCDESFEKLINSYKEYLYKTAFLYVKNEHDALDIYQETVYKAYINIQKLRNTKFFKTWIIKILINNVNMTNRHYNKFQDEPVEDYIGEIEYSNIEENIDLNEAIDRLEEKYKTPVIVVTGAIGENIQEAYNKGITAIFSINKEPMEFSKSALKSKENMILTMENILRLLKI